MTKPKRKARGVENTKLVICEGISDKKFFERMKEVYHNRKCGFTIKLDEAAGGGPKTAIMAAINYNGHFDKKIVYIDSDISIPVDARKAAERKNIMIIQSIPHCLEGLLLKITGHKGEIRDTEHAKTILYRQYELPDVVTEVWYEQYITAQRMDSVAAEDKHCCHEVVKEIISLFSKF